MHRYYEVTNKDCRLSVADNVVNHSAPLCPNMKIAYTSSTHPCLLFCITNNILKICFGIILHPQIFVNLALFTLIYSHKWTTRSVYLPRSVYLEVYIHLAKCIPRSGVSENYIYLIKFLWNIFSIKKNIFQIFHFNKFNIFKWIWFVIMFYKVITILL